MSDSDQILAEAAAWRREGFGVAVATVVATWGSSPRPVGSKLAVDQTGRMIGSVSGGCVEGAVIERAQEIIRDGGTQLLEFGVTDADAWEVGLACGGRVRIFVEALTTPKLLEELLATHHAGCTTALLTDLASGKQVLLREMGGGPNNAADQLGFTAEIVSQIDRAVLDDRSRSIEGPEGGMLLVEVWNPPPRLYLVGGVHIAQALIPMARALGYGVLLIDPRARFGSADRFPDVEIASDWPDEVLARRLPDRRTAVITLSHDPKIDDPALIAALRSPAFYIGALGSRRTHATRVARLLALGFDQADADRIHGPVGLPIGAVTPAEIAVSIIAELTAVLRKRSGGALSTLGGSDA